MSPRALGLLFLFALFQPVVNAQVASEVMPRIHETELQKVLDGGDVDPRLRALGGIPSPVLIVFDEKGDLLRGVAGDLDAFLVDPLISGRKAMVAEGVAGSLEEFVDRLVWPKGTEEQRKTDWVAELKPGQPTVFVVADRFLPGLCQACEEIRPRLEQSFRSKMHAVSVFDLNIHRSVFDQN